MNTLIRRKRADGTFTVGESICPEHLAELEPDTFIDTGFPAGRVQCETCRLLEQEAKQELNYVDPEKVNRIVTDIVSSLSPVDHKAISSNPQLVAMLIGFVHAMVFCNVEQEDIKQIGLDTLLNVWTGVRKVEK